MGRLGTTRGVLSSLFMAKDVERDWLAVVDSGFRYSSIGGEEVLPSDAYHALGIFYRLVPDWWIVQVIAGTRGDLERSIEMHEKSLQDKPVVANYKELAASQLCLGTKKGDDALISAGLANLDKGIALPVRSELNKIDRAHCKKLRADPGLACGYSRDGQQELDKKKLEK